jgi:hypothetical protein
MLPFGVTIPATVPQRSEIPEGLKNYRVFHSTFIAFKKLERARMMTLKNFNPILFAVRYKECLNIAIN